MRPKTQEPLVFNNKCNAMFDKNLLESAMLWYADGVLFSKRNIFLYNCYPSVSFGDLKIGIHRLLMSHKIQRKLSSRENVHHIDNDPLNANIDNLDVMMAGDHQRFHLKGRKQDPHFAMERTDKSSMARYGKHTKQWIEFHDSEVTK